MKELKGGCIQSISNFTSRYNSCLYFFAEESLNCILITNEEEIAGYSKWCIYNGILFYAYPV